MKRSGWIGWIVAALTIVLNSTSGLAAPGVNNPLEGHLLARSTGDYYIYHDGMKFSVAIAAVGDAVIDAIPNGIASQWQGTLLVKPELPAPVPANLNPVPFPGYS
jgi:hypothetical protein